MRRGLADLEPTSKLGQTHPDATDAGARLERWAFPTLRTSLCAASVI